MQHAPLDSVIPLRIRSIKSSLYIPITSNSQKTQQPKPLIFLSFFRKQRKTWIIMSVDAGVQQQREEMISSFIKPFRGILPWAALLVSITTEAPKEFPLTGKGNLGRPNTHQRMKQSPRSALRQLRAVQSFLSRALNSPSLKPPPGQGSLGSGTNAGQTNNVRIILSTQVFGLPGRKNLKSWSFLAPTTAVNLWRLHEIQAALHPRPLCLSQMVLLCSHQDWGVRAGIRFMGLLVAVLGK